MTIAQIQVRRGTAATWTTNNPTLGSGEWGLETDTGKVKMGNGGTAWNSLAYFGDYVAALDAVQDQIDVLGLRQIVKFTSSGSFTKATYPWLKYVRIRLVGGGGGGGGTAATGVGQWAAAGGGGGGGYSEKVIAVGSLGTSETVTVGAGGAAGAAGNNPGGDGGTTSFGAHCSGAGGTGGIGSSADNTYNSHAGGTGGSGASGDINIPGSDGFYGITTVAGPTSLGYGGDAHLGLGGNNPGAGEGYGGGGYGNSVTGSASAGAGYAGAAGIVIVELYG